MTSSKPYLLRAIYEWLLDNHLTPYVLVDAMRPHVSVPQQHVEDNQIILNISPQAVSGMIMNNDELDFEARFSGIVHRIYVPISAVMAIYSYENGRGMVFEDEDDGGDPPPVGDQTPPPKGRPQLKVVK